MEEKAEQEKDLNLPYRGKKRGPKPGKKRRLRELAQKSNTQ